MEAAQADCRVGSPIITGLSLFTVASKIGSMKDAGRRAEATA